MKLEVTSVIFAAALTACAPVQRSADRTCEPEFHRHPDTVGGTVCGWLELLTHGDAVIAITGNGQRK